MTVFDKAVGWRLHQFWKARGPRKPRRVAGQTGGSCLLPCFFVCYHWLVENQRLSPRETEILVLYAKGYSNPDISSMLGIALKTVEAHKYRSKIKLGLTDESGNRQSSEFRRLAIGWYIEREVSRRIAEVQ